MTHLDRSVLLDIAELLRREGWCQRHARAATSTHPAARDLRRAIQDAAGPTFFFTTLYDDLCAAIGSHDLEAWNDAPDRTFHDVLAALHTAFERSEERAA